MLSRSFDIPAQGLAGLLHLWLVTARLSGSQTGAPGRPQDLHSLLNAPVRGKQK